MVKTWIPDGWEEIMQTAEPRHCGLEEHEGYHWRDGFEAGATAMLQALREHGTNGLYRGLWKNIDDSSKWQVVESLGTYPLDTGKRGTLVFIPED